MRQDDYQKTKLVETAWRHGNEYGGHLGSCMVMSVLANRFRLGWGGWLTVIDNIPKFSAQVEQPTGTPVIWEPGFVKLLHEVEGIYDGTMDYAKGALYWCDTRRVDNPWFKEKILGDLEKHPRIGEMNTLALFR